MRIVFVTPHLGDVFGQERVLRDSARLLKEKGHRIFFLTNDLNGAPPPGDGVRTVPDLTNVHSLTLPTVVKQRHQAALQFLAQVRPDIVHFIDHVDERLISAIAKKYSTVYAAHSAACTCPASHRLVNGNAICTEKSGWSCYKNSKSFGCLDTFKGSIRKAHVVHNYLLKRDAFKKVDRVIAVSGYIRELLMKDGWDPSRISVIPNPVTIPKSVTKRADVPEKLIYVAARLAPLKGINYLLMALGTLKDETWNLWISGDGPQKAELLALTENLGLSQRVKFLGKTPYEETQQLMASAYCLIQPNLGPESFGLSVAEASGMGVPVIAYNVPGVDEIVEHGRNGFLVERANVPGMAAAIKTLLKDEVLAKRLGSEGPKLIRAKFSPEYHLDKTLKLYREIVENEIQDENLSTQKIAGKI